MPTPIPPWIIGILALKLPIDSVGIFSKIVIYHSSNYIVSSTGDNLRGFYIILYRQILWRRKNIKRYFFLDTGLYAAECGR
jgi:hypothetical protein